MQKLVDYTELPEIVRNFVKYKLTVQGRSQKTMDEYALDLRTFFRFIVVRRHGGDARNMSEEELAAVDITGVDTGVACGVTS